MLFAPSSSLWWLQSPTLPLRATQSLRSPARLAAVAQERQLKLVARSTLSAAGASSSLAADRAAAFDPIRLAADADDTRD